MISKTKQKHNRRARRHRRIRGQVYGTAERPRLCVYRSNVHISVQLIDDEAMKTLVSASDVSLPKGKSFFERAQSVGTDIAAKAKEKGISKVVFDRGGFIYSGRIKALAEAAREGGLEF